METNRSSIAAPAAAAVVTIATTTITNHCIDNLLNKAAMLHSKWQYLYKPQLKYDGVIAQKYANEIHCLPLWKGWIQTASSITSTTWIIKMKDFWGQWKPLSVGELQTVDHKTMMCYTDNKKGQIHNFFPRSWCIWTGTSGAYAGFLKGDYVCDQTQTTPKSHPFNRQKLTKPAS